MRRRSCLSSDREREPESVLDAQVLLDVVASNGRILAGKVRARTEVLSDYVERRRLREKEDLIDASIKNGDNGKAPFPFPGYLKFFQYPRFQFLFGYTFECTLRLFKFSITASEFYSREYILHGDVGENVQSSNYLRRSLDLRVVVFIKLQDRSSLVLDLLLTQTFIPDMIPHYNQSLSLRKSQRKRTLAALNKFSPLFIVLLGLFSRGIERRNFRAKRSFNCTTPPFQPPPNRLRKSAFVLRIGG